MIDGFTVSCLVIQGTFNSEYEVKIAPQGNLLWKGTVDKELVFGVDESRVQNDYVPGRLIAYIVEYNKGASNALVEFPVEGWSQGKRSYVPVDLIRKEKIPA